MNINTASPALLSHVSGLNKTISENIVKYRDDHGRISSREEIKKVPRLGAKAFEQAAGFLRIPGAKNILDNTGVHPESYKAVERLLKELDITDLDDSAKTKLQAVSVKDMAETIGLGQETLKDIIADLLNQVVICVMILKHQSFAKMCLTFLILKSGKNWKELFEMWSILEPLLISVFTMMA